MAHQRRVFSPEFKLRVVQEVASGQSQASIARRYDLCPHLIQKWKQAVKPGRLGGEATAGPSIQELLADQRVKAEIIQEQAQEIHLLKKALAISRSPNASASSTMNGKTSRSKKPALR